MSKPLSFGATMLATICGIVIVSIVCGLMMFFMTIAMVASLSKLDSKETVNVRKGTVLNVNLAQISGDRTATAFDLSFSNSSNMGLIDAVNAIHAAADDDNIIGILVSEPTSTPLSWGSMKELRDAIATFREGGKFVVAYATDFSQGGYYVASLSDIICLHPAGMVDFRGFGAQVMYYKDLLDRLGVEMQLIRPESCSYKSAGEVYTLNHMSDANREQIHAYINSNWNTVVSEISASRAIPISDLNQIADNLSGYLATDALHQHIVDTLCFESDMRANLKDKLDATNILPLSKYASAAKKCPNKAKSSIAVIYAEGNVMDGSSKGLDRGVYGDDIVKALKQAVGDDNVKAIVLRVNSPGGAATASESMTHAVMQAREKKPVVVSMGDLAASAGYEMSCMADVIVAQPTTITGSIGVFGTIPNANKLLRNKLGLNVDTASTNRNSAGMSILMPLSPTAMRMMNRNVEDFYKTFVSRVAEGRHRTYDEIHQIARGRVWTGSDALRIGLVDTLGGLDVALGIAANLAGVDNYRVAEFPKEKDTWTLLAEMLSDEQADDNINLLSRIRLAWQYKMMKQHLPTPLGQAEADLQYISSAEGLQARMPFVLIAD